MSTTPAPSNTNTENTKKSLIDSLKGLLEAFGGEYNNEKNIINIIDKISETVNASNQEETSTEPFVVIFNAKKTGSDLVVCTCDKHYNEILTELTNNNTILVKCIYSTRSTSNDDYTIQATYYQPIIKVTTSEIFFIFSQGPDLKIFETGIAIDDSIDYFEET